MKTQMQLLYSEDVIANRVETLAEELDKKYSKSKMVHVVVTLNGSFMFVADLIRKLNFPITIYFAGSVTNNVEPIKNTRINSDALPKSFGHEPVIVIEDIIDSGKTIKVLREMIAERFAGSIDIVALIKRQSCQIAPDYSCFTVPEGMFLVGYGLDLEGRYRELSSVYALGIAMNKVCGTC
ncbi:MAG: hypothetical protein GY793_06790 [Proteobacteria bacterium]|nr:hypothetical protein [Pseudomonadota bacterium]